MCGRVPHIIFASTYNSCSNGCGSNSCGSSCELNSGPSGFCTACDNGCKSSCAVGCGGSSCSGVCDSVSCYSYCSGNCINSNCGRNTCDNAACRTSCDGGKACGNNCHNGCGFYNCVSYCYSACASWVTYVTGGCSSSSCSATGRNIFYYVVLNISLKLLGVIIWVEKEKFLKNQKV